MARNTASKRDQRQSQFATIPSANIQRSVLNRSCGYKSAFDSALLVPIFVDEALPGDTMTMHMTAFTRMATPIFPVMDNFYMDFFFFSVPYRLVWDNWQKMNGEQTDPGDSTDFLVPQMDAPVGGHLEESLSDYMGIPTKVDITHSSLWHRAYNLIYNEWFRSEDLVDSVVVDKGDGPDDTANYSLLKRGKRHDYFTSCLPWPQKGPAVVLPLGTSAPIVSEGTGEPTFSANGVDGRNIEAGLVQGVTYSGALASGQTMSWDDPALEVDLSTATSATINELRESFQIQKLYERDARGGTRYTEIIRSHFGVVSPDQRLQRPEYLGGGSMRIGINPVAATFDAGGSREVGELGAYATGATENGFNKSFVEHSLLIGIACVRADLHYQQGLDRMFSRRSRFDFYWPALANIGEQAVLNKEIFADGSANDDLVFGYQERHAEYRYKPSKVTGRMRSNSAVSLDNWHLAQDFAALPVLDATFISEDPPFARVIAVPSEPEFLFDAWFEYKCARPMPVRSVPGLIDHF